MGHQFVDPWGSFAKSRKFPNKLLHVAYFEESVILIPKIQKFAALLNVLVSHSNCHLIGVDDKS